MTAVEWLVEQIENGKIEIVYSDKIHLIKCLPEFVEQALIMEKQQHEKEFERGFLKCADTLQFILDKGLLNNYNNDTNDNGSYKLISRTKR